MTATTAIGIDEAVRARLALALDVDDLVAALRLARRLRAYFGTAKVGLELIAAVGPDVIGALRELGYEVFVDAKLHDIPNTVHRAATVYGSLGASYVTMHAFGGRDMLRAGDAGLAQGASEAGLECPTTLAVTVLTSDRGAPNHIVAKRLETAMAAGCGGLVCAAADLPEVRTLAPAMTRVVPGIRLADGDAHDQARTATPQEAVAAGADLLVIGRTVTAADDPEAAASVVAAEVAAAVPRA